MLAALPLVFLASSVLCITFGSFCTDENVLLQIFCIERLAAGLVRPCVVALTMTGHERNVLTIVLIGGILTLGAIYVGDLLGGAIGIA